MPTRRAVVALLLLLPLASAPAARAQGTGFPRGALRERGLHGGAYLGVGPEQGFSYIDEIEPKLAIIIDIRRDNLLLHLLMKAMFLAVPEHRSRRDDLPRDTLVACLDRTPLDTGLQARQHEELMRRVDRFGLLEDAEDMVPPQPAVPGVP